MWWPNGLGAQPLYPLEVSYVGPDSVSINRIKRIGFRTIELVQETTGIFVIISVKIRNHVSISYWVNFKDDK